MRTQRKLVSIQGAWSLIPTQVVLSLFGLRVLAVAQLISGEDVVILTFSSRLLSIWLGCYPQDLLLFK
jgi:hypothetical protein